MQIKCDECGKDISPKKQARGARFCCEEHRYKFHNRRKQIGLRAQFAGLAMQGMLCYGGWTDDYDELAKESVRMADVLIEQLKAK